MSLIECPCGRNHRVPDIHAGRTIRCRCQRLHAVPLRATVVTDSATSRKGFDSAVWVYGAVLVGLLGLRVWAEEARVAPPPLNVHAEAPAPFWNRDDFSPIIAAPTGSSELTDFRVGYAGATAYGEIVSRAVANSRWSAYLDYETPAPVAGTTASMTRPWIDLHRNHSLGNDRSSYSGSGLQPSQPIYPIGSIEPTRPREPLRPGSLRRRNDEPQFANEPGVTTSTQSGMTHYSGDVSGTTQHVGGFSYPALSAGGRTVSGTTSHVGRMSYTNWSDGTSATTQHIGSMSYTNASDGMSATTQHVGSFSYTTSSDGSSATTQRIGNFSYTTVSP